MNVSTFNNTQMFVICMFLHVIIHGRKNKHVFGYSRKELKGKIFESCNN